jgi:drug/metabolite transporter (DMT)-like permease
MGIGSITLLGFGLAFEKNITLQNWAIIFILAAFNTAFAFTLWSHTPRTLRAIESNVINNTMTFQISILAWIFLDERFNLIQGVGLFIAIIGAILVQTRASRYEIKLEGKP